MLGGMLSHSTMSISIVKLSSVFLLFPLFFAGCSGRNIDESKREQIIDSRSSGFETTSFSYLSVSQMSFDNFCTAVACKISFAISFVNRTERDETSQHWTDTLVIKNDNVLSVNLKNKVGSIVESTSSNGYKNILFLDTYHQAVQQNLGTLPNPFSMELKTAEAYLVENTAENPPLAHGNVTTIKYSFGNTHDVINLFSFDSKNSIDADEKTACQAWGFANNESLRFRAAVPRGPMADGNYEYLDCRYEVKDNNGILTFSYFNSYTFETREVATKIIGPL